MELITDAELLAHGIAATAMSEVAEPTRDIHRAGGSSFVLSKLQKRYKLPLLSWSDDVKRCTAHIVAFDLLSLRGFNPRSGSDVAIKLRRDEAVKWLDEVVDGRAEPEAIVDSSTDVDERGVLIGSDDAQGWDYPLSAQVTTYGDDW